MLLWPRKNGLTSLFKEVWVFKEHDSRMGSWLAVVSILGHFGAGLPESLLKHSGSLEFSVFLCCLGHTDFTSLARLVYQSCGHPAVFKDLLTVVSKQCFELCPEIYFSSTLFKLDNPFLPQFYLIRISFWTTLNLILTLDSPEIINHNVETTGYGTMESWVKVWGNFMGKFETWKALIETPFRTDSRRGLLRADQTKPGHIGPRLAATRRRQKFCQMGHFALVVDFSLSFHGGQFSFLAEPLFSQASPLEERKSLLPLFGDPPSSPPPPNNLAPQGCIFFSPQQGVVAKSQQDRAWGRGKGENKDMQKGVTWFYKIQWAHNVHAKATWASRWPFHLTSYIIFLPIFLRDSSLICNAVIATIRRWGWRSSRR